MKPAGVASPTLPQRHLLSTKHNKSRGFSERFWELRPSAAFYFSFCTAATCPDALPTLLWSLLPGGPLWACHHSTFEVLKTLSEPSQGGAVWTLAGPRVSAQGLSSSAAGGLPRGMQSRHLLPARGPSSCGTFWANHASAGSAPAPSTGGTGRGARLSFPPLFSLEDRADPPRKEKCPGNSWHNNRPEREHLFEVFLVQMIC